MEQKKRWTPKRLLLMAVAFVVGVVAVPLVTISIRAAVSPAYRQELAQQAAKEKERLAAKALDARTAPTASAAPSTAAKAQSAPSPKETSTPSTPVPEGPKLDLELLDFGSSTNEFGITITGRIRNNTSRKYNHVQVTFNCYNKAGEQLGTALASSAGLEPKGIWRFKATGMYPTASNCKFDKIMGYSLPPQPH